LKEETIMLTRPIAFAVLGACLLPACVSLPERMQLLFQPAQQVRHSGNDVASSYFRLGRYHQDHGNLDLALTAYTYAIARDPRHAGARSAAAAIHAQQGRLAQARAMLLAVAAEYPALAQPHNNLGYVYHLQGDYSAAAQAFRRALAIEPGNERARNNLALAEAGAAPQAPVLLAAAPVAPAAAPVAPPPAAVARMELVTLAPNMYELKLHTPEPVAVALPVPGAGAPASRLEVANGNGVTGIAKRVKLALGKRGIAVARLTNARPFSQVETSIQFLPGFEQQALHLQATMGGTPVLKAVAELPMRTDLRLVLGKDASDKLSAPRLMAASSVAHQ
jgi:tetratricopeptide (TPR) repeat protein